MFLVQSDKITERMDELFFFKYDDLIVCDSGVTNLLCNDNFDSDH